MNWFKRLFSVQTLYDFDQLKAFVTKSKQQATEDFNNHPPVREKEISEPVLAIVECMKKYPSRFKFKLSIDPMHFRSCRVLDIKTKEVFKAARRSPGIWLDCCQFEITPRSFYYIRERPWLTEDEELLLIETFQDIQEVKRKRKESIKMVGYNKDRSRLKEIYK